MIKNFIEVIILPHKVFKKKKKKDILKISQTSQQSTCARVSFLINLQAWTLQLYSKRDSGTGIFL